MKVFRFSLLSVPLLTLVSLSILPMSASARRQTITGKCNVGIMGDGNGVSINCAAPLVFGDPETSKVELFATINNLYAGHDRFTLEISNNSMYHIAHLNIHSLTLVDNNGNTYRPDRLGMFDAGLRQEIPPNAKIKLKYVLNSGISRQASSVQFILNNISAQSVNDGFRHPFQPLRWTTKLNSQSGSILIPAPTKWQNRFPSPSRSYKRFRSYF